jgi:hypothetical protein
MATIVNIIVSNDADFYRGFSYQQVDGTPIDLTGVSMVMMARRHAADKAAQLRLGTDTGEIVITDGPNGIFTLLMRQATLERLALGTYDQSLVMTQSGYKTAIWEGTLTNEPGPSR